MFLGVSLRLVWMIRFRCRKVCFMERASRGVEGVLVVFVVGS